MAFRCSICDVSYNSQKKIDTHYNTKKHKKQVLFNKDLSYSSEDTTEENDVHVIISNMDAKFTLALDEQKQSIEKLKKENEALRKKVLCLESARRGDIINSYNGNNQIINSNPGGMWVGYFFCSRTSTSLFPFFMRNLLKYLSKIA